MSTWPSENKLAAGMQTGRCFSRAKGRHPVAPVIATYRTNRNNNQATALPLFFINLVLRQWHNKFKFRVAIEMLRVVQVRVGSGFEPTRIFIQGRYGKSSQRILFLNFMGFHNKPLVAAV